MFNFVIKFFNISTIIFFFNIFLFTILLNIFTTELALIITLIIVFFLNFFFISYSFEIKNNKLSFFIGLVFLSLFFRIFEYFIFYQLLKFLINPTLTWLISLLLSFIIKVFIYKSYFSHKSFKLENSKKKVIVFSPNFKNGGAEKNTLLLSELLISKGFDVIMVSWSKNSLKYNKQLKTFYINKPNISSSFFDVLFFIIKEKPNFIFSSLNHLNIFLGLIKILSGTNSKLIIRESNFLSLKLKDELKNRKIKIFFRKIFTFISYNSSSTIICPSKNIYKDLNKNFFINKKLLKFIPNLFINNNFFLKNFKKPFKNYLVAVGRIETQKNYLFMLDAFNQSLNLEKNNLIIIGNGSEKKSLFKKVKQLKLSNRVKIFNNRKNIGDYLINSKGLIMTSNYEGMPNILLEATSIGLNCLITRFPGSSYFKKYKNVLISSFDVREFSKKIMLINKQKKIPSLFKKEFLTKQNENKFLKCFYE